MRGTKLRRIIAMLTVFAIVMIVASTSVGRQSRKGSSSRSSSGSRSSGSSRSSSGGSSSRSSGDSSSSSDSRSSSGSTARSSSSSSRTYRKTTPPRISTSTSPGRISTSRSLSGAATSRSSGTSGRISRKRSSITSSPSAPSSTLRSGRIDRRYYSYSDHPPAHRSLYHYHRNHYPSSRVFYWVSWPDCCRPICYSWGPHYTFGSFWPYYHRRFVFVSLGGYWPYYSYRRYYWYGCHPYSWYGYHPPAYVVDGDTYNYYYYNDPPDGERLNEAHKKYEQVPRPDPAEESQTDRYFEQGVSAFEAGDYAAAAQKFHEAQQLTPNDIVLPFARIQALFAAGEYHTATAVLREALVVASPEKEGVFYPRGLYGEEGILLKQIEQLSRAVQLSPADSDLRLLLGYQLLGMSRVDEAAVHLQSAGLDSGNNRAATVLMKLLEKLRKPAAGADSNVEEPQPATPKPQEPPLSGNGSAKTPPTPKRKDVDMVAVAMAADNWLAAQ